jgi:hypothetical protein
VAHAPRRPRWLLWLAAVGALVFLATTVWVATRTDPAIPSAAVASSSSTATATTLPGACADALALADLLASHVGPLADAANEHVEVMEKLDLFLEGKPGGINGQQAYDQGETQMAVMEEHGPDAEVQTRRYQKVRKRCPIR